MIHLFYTLCNIDVAPFLNIVIEKFVFLISSVIFENCLLKAL